MVGLADWPLRSFQIALCDTRRYDGAEWVTNVVIEPRREVNHHSQEPILLDSNAEVADDSPTANTLALFQHIVAEVARAQEGDREPRRLRAQIFRG